MENFVNTSMFRPEVFLSLIPWWSWEIHGYPVVMICWNIILAGLAIWFSYLVTQDIRTGQKQAFKSIGLLVIWILMVPNTAYLLTETRHSLSGCAIDIYNHICSTTPWGPIFFFFFGTLGWVSFIWSVRPIETAIAKKYGQNASSWFVISALLLISLGVLLGLVNRFNSWEIVTDPLKIILTSVYYFFNLTALKNYFMMTFLLFILYLAGSYLIIRLPWEKKASKS